MSTQWAQLGRTSLVNFTVARHGLTEDLRVKTFWSLIGWLLRALRQIPQWLANTGANMPGKAVASRCHFATSPARGTHTLTPRCLLGAGPQGGFEPRRPRREDEQTTVATSTPICVGCATVRARLAHVAPPRCATACPASAEEEFLLERCASQRVTAQSP
jgi:hypothetical protein